MKRLLGAVLAVLVAASAASSTARLAEMPEAPDGHPGLGTERSAREVAKYLRKPPRQDREELESWSVLPSTLQVLWNEYARRMESAGRFACVDAAGADPTLAELFATWRAAAADLPAALAEDAPHAELLARLHVDVRFRSLAQLAAEDGLERRELLAGLAVLHGMNDGYVTLTDDEAAEICARVDLAAARLRSMALDVEALGDPEAAGPGAPTEEAVDALLAAARDPDENARARRVGTIERDLERTRQRLAETLFSARLAREVDEALRRREAAIQDAARVATEVRPFLPELPEGAEPGEEIAGMKKSHRYAYALRLSVEGLARDPLNGDLAYFAAISSDFTHGERVTRPWFDRFLAIRGIREGGGSRQEQTERPLDEWERRAWDAVQGTSPAGLPR